MSDKMTVLVGPAECWSPDDLDRADLAIDEEGRVRKDRYGRASEGFAQNGWRVPKSVLVAWLVDPVRGAPNLETSLGIEDVCLVPLGPSLAARAAQSPAHQEVLAFMPLEPCPRDRMQILSRQAVLDHTVRIEGIDEEEARGWSEVVIRVGVDYELNTDEAQILCLVGTLLDGMMPPAAASIRGTFLDGHRS